MHAVSSPFAQTGSAMADDHQLGEQARQHMRRMLARLADFLRKRAQEQNTRSRSVDIAVEVEREKDPPGLIRDSQRPT
jgi:hypothetical protein